MLDKTKCDYCKGVTLDDEFGNCAACGAPRSEENVYTSFANMRNPLPAALYRNSIICASTSSDIGFGYYAST